jgi:hypothetical protein
VASPAIVCLSVLLPSLYLQVVAGNKVRNYKFAQKYEKRLVQANYLVLKSGSRKNNVSRFAFQLSSSV